MRQSDRDDGRRDDGLTGSGLEEPRRQRRENLRPREEREIPDQAAVWLARGGRHGARAGFELVRVNQEMDPENWTVR